MRGPLFVVEDLNSKAIEWSTQTVDTRNRCILGMAARLELIVANTIFRKSGYGGIPSGHQTIIRKSGETDRKLGFIKGEEFTNISP